MKYHVRYERALIHTIMNRNEYLIAWLRTGCVLLLLTLGGLSARAGTLFWSSPTNGNWNDATMWSTGTVPQAGDSVFINQDGTYFMEAIRSGALGLDELTNFVDTIVISNQLNDGK